jgi:hypothetical protein
MPIYTFRTSSYARNIYLYGTQLFADIPVAYVDPVMVYAVETFTQTQIDNALDKDWISEDEYNQTLAKVIA